MPWLRTLVRVVAALLDGITTCRPGNALPLLTEDAEEITTGLEPPRNVEARVIP